MSRAILRFDRRDRRAVSTVVDVSLAVLLVSAAVLVLAVHVDGPDETHDPIRADQTASTVAGTTISVEYSLESAVRESDSDAFDHVDEYDSSELVRVSHGPSAGLIADAAVANVRFGPDDADRLTHAGIDFERAVDGALRSTLTGSNDHVQVVATWRPHENSTIDGTTTVGRSPPPDEDVSSVTMTVPSGIRDVRAQAIDEAGYANYDDVARVVATATIEGLCPPDRSQRALESSGLERALTVDRYERLATLIDGADPEADEFEPTLERAGGNVTAANAYLIDHLTAQLERELERSYDDPEAAARAVSTGEVALTVRTWNTNTNTNT